MTLIIMIYYDFYMTYLGVSDNRIGPPPKKNMDLNIMMEW